MQTITNNLALELGEQLAKSRQRVTTAESCTGGGVASAITEVAGSSGWFEVGYVTYSNRHKQQVLGVAKSILAEHGAVSDIVARQMTPRLMNIKNHTAAHSSQFMQPQKKPMKVWHIHMHTYGKYQLLCSVFLQSMDLMIGQIWHYKNLLRQL